MRKGLRHIYLLGLVLLGLLTSAPVFAGGFIRDAEIEKLLLDYATPIFLAAGLNPDNVGMGIIDDRRLNAFVAGGQNIFFHTGLILEADTPNVVIGVIAHEVGHIKGGHLARMPGAIAKARTPAVIATILGIGALVAGQGDAGLALITGGQQIAERSFLTYSRAQEAAADQVALQLLEATEQSPEGIIELMGDLADQEILSEVNQDPYARSHPMSRDRANAYEAGRERSAFREVKDSPQLQKRHDLAKAKIYGFLDHPSTTLRRYAEQNDLPARYAKSIAYHKRGLTDESLTLIDTLIAEQPNNPYFYELKGQVLFEAGRIPESSLPYAKSVALDPNEPLLLIGLAATKVALEKKTTAREAIKLLKQALRFDPDNTTAYFQLARAYSQIGEIARAELATAERFFLYGQTDKAKKHARRAAQQLKKGSPEWIRARDIAADI
ncbi:MAG: M48 family metalloprotease [Alphaproteobacteria bacterium]|nr:M48 family metalloprotease [Alphaproteobacteria bacterium]